jgi:DNA polymerase III delta subunit
MVSNNRFILKTKDDFQVDSFLYKLEKDYPKYSCKRYYDAEELVDKVSSGSLFEDDKEIAVLMALDAPGVKALNGLDFSFEGDPIVLIQRKSIPKTKAYTHLTVDFDVKKLDSLKAADCVRWVSATLKSREIKYSKNVPDTMVSIIGNNQYSLLNEINKLSLLASNLSLDDSNIESYLATSSNADYFSFMDHLTHKRVSEALAEFDKVDPKTYVKLIGFIVSQLEKFYKISIYRAQSYTPEEIADLVGIPPFILKTKIFTVYSFMPKVKLLKALDIFLELSYKLRSIKYNKKLIFESYLLKVFKL